MTEDELLSLLKGLKEQGAYEAAAEQTRRFRQEFVDSCGHGTDNVLNAAAKN